MDYDIIKNLYYDDEKVITFYAYLYQILLVKY